MKKLRNYEIAKYHLYIPLLVVLTACLPVGKSDLVPKQIFYDPDNVLNITFKNEGEAAVPANKGNLGIFIDGRPIGGYSFSILGDQSFRNPGGSLTIRTNFRMSESNRRIAVFIDTQKEIDESNEFNNIKSRTLTPPLKNGPDFVVSNLVLGPGNILNIEVKNIGSANSPAGLQVKIRVIVNERVAADLTPTLPTLTAGGGTTIINPAPPIVVSPNSKVRVLLNTNHLFDELDSTNNVKEAILPDGLSLAPYQILLSTPKIANNIIWETYRYSDWTPSQKNDLNEALLALEKGEQQSLTEPPAVHNYFISANDAWKIYIAHVAQSLWVETHGIVPWHLLDFPDDQLRILLDSQYLVYKYGNEYIFHLGIGEVTPWNPRIPYEFLSNLRIIKSSQLETIYAFTDWIRGHLGHMGGSETLTDVFGYAGYPPTDKMLYALEGKGHRTRGCTTTSAFYAAVLRSVNMPVIKGDIKLKGSMFPDETHTRPIFPSVDRSMPHGDDPYTGWFDVSGAVVPTEKLFYTTAEMDTKFINPILDCVAGVCNTVGEQASYNKDKIQIQLAYDYMTDYILYLYATGGPSYLNDQLRGDYLKTLFTDTERATMVAAVENKIREIGGGDLDAGKSKVISRLEQWRNTGWQR